MDRVSFALFGRPVLLPARHRGAHEKGGVEGQIGWFRRNHLVPVPEVDSFEQLNAMVDAWDTADDARRMGSRAHTAGELFAIEQPLLLPLPDEPLETASGSWAHASTATVRSPSAPTATPFRRGWSAGRSGSTCTPPTWSSTTAAPRWPDTTG